MLNIKLLILLLPAASALTCTSYYDYSTPIVSCKGACPSGTKQIGNKCLLAYQYIQNNSVHVCSNGWTNDNQTQCCPGDSFYLSYNGTETCQICHGNTYNMGKLCCPGSSYADLTSSPGVCRKLKTGSCPTITMKNLFQVCCPQGLFYHIQLQQCISPASYNCDPIEKICCRSGKRLQYVNGKLICVSRCDWQNNDGFYCRKRFCDKANRIKKVSGMDSTNLPIPLYALKGSCCYGNTVTGGCQRSADACEKRFVNRGWSVCCLHGEFYDIKQRRCVSKCTGYLVYEFLCVVSGSMINLQSESGAPQLMSSTNLCNGKPLPQNFPLCCPTGFYINGTDGCKLCYGRIFKANLYQVCCPFGQIFNRQKNQCQKCSGITDQQGLICCLKGQYVNYNTYGLASCASSCPNDQLYNGEYCCNSLGNSQCQIQSFVPTTCNIAYFNSKSCQVCPRLCSLPSTFSNICTTSTSQVTNCEDQCPKKTVFFPQLGECLACDPSCLSCSQPMESIYCQECELGFVKQGGKCTRCNIECQTCSRNSTSCSSCSKLSSKPLLVGDRCIQNCGSSKYWDFSQSRCLNCTSICSECLTASTTQCSKCVDSYYLSGVGTGSCVRCPSTCSTCYSNLCYKCTNASLVLNSRICGNNCPSTSTLIYRPWLGHQECVQCSSNCVSCSGLPQNCTGCKSNAEYLADKIGVYMCYPCPAPCVFCTAEDICTTCMPGYYRNSSKCSPCHESCATCFGGSDSQCVSCFGVSQLISGKCIGCSSSCARCDINKNCLECAPSFVLYNGNCGKSCPPKTYPSNVQCFDCMTNCSTCTNNTLCTTCAPTHYLEYNGLCLTECPSGYEERNKICEKVIIPDPIIPIIPVVPNTTDPTNNQTKPVVPPSPPINPPPVYPEDPTQDNDPNKNNKDAPVIKTQTITIDEKNKKILIRTIFQDPVDPSSITLEFFFIDMNTNKKIKLQTKSKVQRSKLKQGSQVNELSYEADIPSGMKLSSNALQTNILQDGVSFRDSSYLSSKSLSEFLFYDYKTDPLRGLQYIGLAFTILIIIFSIFTKSKGHFIAEEANTIILHMLNFIQTVYLFKFTNVHADGMYHFLNGFGFMHFLFFPNFFYGTIPQQYYEYAAEKSLIPDGNFIRGAGSSISFMLIALVIMLIAVLVSYLIYKKKFLSEMPQVRKITRLGILFIHITFMNLMFTALSYLIQPHISEPTGTRFQNSCRAVSITFAVVLPIACIGIIYHFYKTYNSDVLEHYYTLRQAAHLTLIIFQCFIFAFSIGKPLICLFLIPLELLWLGFNFMLYKYGEGDRIKDHLKLIISTVCIIISYLFLSLNGIVNWIAIVVIVSIVVVVLIVYSSYQVVGLYYNQMFKKKQ